MELAFEGGPRAGQRRPYDGNKPPKTAGCVTEAMRCGMVGHYRLRGISPDLQTGYMVWVEMQPPKPRRRKT